MRRQGFNSLQTGKWILTVLEDWVKNPKDILFQFPSNGKVDPNYDFGTSEMEETFVSIPFKRESGS